MQLAPHSLHQQGEITQNVRKQAMSCFTYHHGLFYISVKYHENIPKDIQFTEQKKSVKNKSMGDNSKNVKAIYMHATFVQTSL